MQKISQINTEKSLRLTFLENSLRGGNGKGRQRGSGEEIAWGGEHRSVGVRAIEEGLEDIGRRILDQGRISLT